jgi:hypothetical protein
MGDNIDEVRASIHRKASARAEASVYSLNNTFLTTPQKAQIEAVYQFPLGVMHYALAIAGLAMSYPFWTAWLAASAVGVVAWLLARFLPGRLFWPIGLAFGGNVSTVVCLALAITAGVMGRYGLAAYLALAGLGLTALIEAPMWLWSTSRGMNPKYRIAKRMFGVTFPFENETA